MADASALRAHLLDWAGAVFDKAVESSVEALKLAAPKGESGDTERLIKATPLSSPPVFAAFVEAPTKQGEWYEDGTVPHRIEGNPLLAFQWNGKLTILPFVNHPGQPARPWFHVTLEREWPEFLRDAASTVH